MPRAAGGRRARCGRATRCAAAFAALLAALLAAARPPAAAGAALSAVQSINQMWEQTALSAAEATLLAVEKQTGRDLSLRGVPLDSLKVFVGQQHMLALELEGVEYKLTFNTDGDGVGFGAEGSSSRGGAGGGGAGGGGGGGGIQGMLAAAAGGTPAMRELPAAQPAGALAAIPPPPLAAVDPFSWPRQHISLPEITVAGPLELVFPAPTQLSLLLPHPAEAPAARRLLVAPGAALTLRGIRGVSLRRPVDLPKLPPSYLAEVLAHAKLGQPEPGFEGAPGMMYLASELHRQATNASLQAGAGRGRQLLSFEVEPAAGGAGITALSPALPPGNEPLRLRLKRLDDGTLEVGLRDAAAAKDQAAGGAAAAAPPPQFAWPLPLAGRSSWLPYEGLLRGVIAAHPFGNLRGALQKGAGLRLTQSRLHGVSLVSFEMELAASDPPPGEGKVSLSDMALGLLQGVDREVIAEGSRGSLEIWEAVVQVRERDDGFGGFDFSHVRERDDGSGGFDFSPVSVRKKHDFHATLTLSPSGLAEALGRGNGTEVYSMTVIPVEGHE